MITTNNNHPFSKEVKMLWEQTVEKLQDLKLSGMLRASLEQQDNRAYEEMSFEDRLGYLVEQEHIERSNRRFQSRLRQARLKQQASIKDINFRSSRGLNKSQILELGNCRWINEHRNLIITGATGSGKSYLACALGHQACLNGHRVRYERVGRLLMDLGMGRGDGSYMKRLMALSRIDLLILDDWGLSKLTDLHRQDLLELAEERYGVQSVIITSQLPVDKWHDIVGDSTIADAILDRVVHNSYRVILQGDSLRKKSKQEVNTTK